MRGVAAVGVRRLGGEEGEEGGGALLGVLPGRLQKLHQFVPTQIDIAEDLPEKSRPERFSCVDGDDGRAAVRVSEERVTPPATKHLEARPLQGTNEALPRDPRQSGHALTR